MTTINRKDGVIDIDKKNYLDEIYLYKGKEKETLMDYIEHVIVDKVYVYYDDETEVIITGDKVKGLGINVKINDIHQTVKTVRVNNISEARELIDLAFDGKRYEITILGLIIEYKKDDEDVSFDYVTVVQD